MEAKVRVAPVGFAQVPGRQDGGEGGQLLPESPQCFVFCQVAGRRLDQSLQTAISSRPPKFQKDMITGIVREETFSDSHITLQLDIAKMTEAKS